MNQNKHDLSIGPQKGISTSEIKSYRLSLFIFISILLVITVYIWLISFGSWTSWHTLTNYYSQLATSFDNGSLSLELKPDASLLALGNPYDPAARAGLNALNDASLYNGKYYLYFGPVPALFLATIKPLGFNNIGDQYLVFGFLSGILILQTLLVLKIWRRFFQDIPLWLVIICIFFIGMIIPSASMLTKARVYEAAIASGQFFLLTGLYFILTAVDKDRISKKYLLVGGVSLTLAIGSRLTQIFPVGLVAAMTAFWIFKKYFKSKLRAEAIYSTISLGLPLILGLAVLGWYNWARFNSVFETGIFYQLAWTNPQKNYREFFSPLYLVQNLYNYILLPPKFRYDIFPYIIAVYGKTHSIISSLRMPNIYNSEKIAGLLYTVPFTVYALNAVISLVYKPLQRIPDDQNGQQLLKWFISILLGSFVCGFLSFLLFFWAALRYFEDFLPPLIILSIIGFWQGYRYCSAHITYRNVYLIIGIGLIVISIVVSTLIALSFGSPRFEEFNPHLWNFLQQ